MRYNLYFSPKPYGIYVPPLSSTKGYLPSNLSVRKLLSIQQFDNSPLINLLTKILPNGRNLSLSLGWIMFSTMKKLGSYIILVKIFYQILIQIFSFSGTIYLHINKVIIKIHLIIIFLPSIVHIIYLCVRFINSPWLLNIK